MDRFENLGFALRWLRNRQGRSQREVAAAAEITKAMLSSYETGKALPTLPTLSKILVALGADLPELHAALVVHRVPAVHRDPPAAPSAADSNLIPRTG
jgi:transcriptional regulator with XRE-family HTH domain